jgi:predicted site-specific integrase-resolvase
MLQSIGKISKELDIHVQTLRDLEKSGKINSYRTVGGHRRYNIDEVKKELLSCNPYIKKEEKKTILYLRISRDEKIEDLLFQKEKLELYAVAKGYKFEIIEDVGSGLDYKRSGFKHLLGLIEDDRVERVVVGCKDRLVGFGFELIEIVCEKHDCEIEIIDNTKDGQTEQETADNLLFMMRYFSSSNYRINKIKKIFRNKKNV